MVVVASILRSLIAPPFRLLIGGLGLAVPHSLRSRYACIAARFLRPAIALGLRTTPLGLLNSDFELSYGYVIRAMTRLGCTFDIPTRVHGEEAIPRGAALFVTGHLFLSTVGVRFLCERGVPVSLIRATSERHYLVGTRTPMPVIVSSDNLLFVKMRNALRAGKSVAVMLDDASTGPLTIRPQAIDVAIRSRIPIVFFGANVAADYTAEVVFERPRGSDAGEIARELLAFITRLAPG